MCFVHVFVAQAQCRKHTYRLNIKGQTHLYFEYKSRLAKMTSNKRMRETQIESETEIANATNMKKKKKEMEQSEPK